MYELFKKKHAQFHYNIQENIKTQFVRNVHMLDSLCVTIIKFVYDYKSIIMTDAPELPKPISNFMYS